MGLIYPFFFYNKNLYYFKNLRSHITETMSERNNTHRGSHMLLWRIAWKAVNVCVRVCLEASLVI